MTQAGRAPATRARSSRRRANSGLVAKVTSSGMPALAQRSGSLSPLPRQIEGPVQQCMALGRLPGQEHADLAVVELARGAAVLTGHPDRLLAFLIKPVSSMASTASSWPRPAST